MNFTLLLTSILPAALHTIALACTTLIGMPAHAQAWPTKGITLVVPFATGGPTDVMARTLSVSLSKTLGQSVVVENKVGAGGTIAAGHVAKSAPDGYTIFLHHNGMASSTALYRKLAFKPLTDFESVTQVADVPMTLLARKDLPAASLSELTTHVKANKDKINLANAGLGAVSHLCGMLFQQALGVDLQTIPHIKAGSVRFYGVTTKQRIEALPDAPTLAEQGLADFEMAVWHGIYAPKGTPADTLAKLNAAMHAALKDPEVTRRFAELGAEIVPEAKPTPEGLQTWLKSEISQRGPMIRAAGKFAD